MGKNDYISFRMPRKTHKKLTMKQQRLQDVVRNISGKKVIIPKTKVIDFALSQRSFVSDSQAQDLMKNAKRRRRRDEF